MNNIHIYTLDSLETKLEKKEENNPIFLIYQFFIHKNKERHSEIQLALKKNVSNEFINKIYLLNERIYTDEELGISSKKIKQILLNKRINFKNIFDFVSGNNLNGYCITCNADIFFDTSLKRLYKTGLHKEKKVFTQLRFEYTDEKLGKCALFKSQLNFKNKNESVPRADSQDCWIFHSNFNIQKKYRKVFNFIFGKRGCDNKVTYLFYILGYKVLNEPHLIKTYHVHKTQIRDYSNKPEDSVPGPYLQIGPKISGKIPINNYPAPYLSLVNNKFKLRDFWNNSDGKYLDIDYGNKMMGLFLKNKIKNNEIFSIVLFNPIIVKLCSFSLLLENRTNLNERQINHIGEKINNNLPLLKQQEGIGITDMEMYVKYCIKNLESFRDSDVGLIGYYLDPEWVKMRDEQSYIKKILIDNKSKLITREALQIYNYIHNSPWTHQLKKKRILIVAPFIDEIKERIHNNSIYGIDLFPECEFIFIKSQHTFGNNPTRHFQVEFDSLTSQIIPILADFDIALIACNGFSNILSHYLKKLKKSSIVVGNLLYMWFGCYTNNDFKDKSDILKLYMNKDWKRVTF